MWVEDDVAQVAHVLATPSLVAYPNPAELWSVRGLQGGGTDASVEQRGGRDADFSPGRPETILGRDLASGGLHMLQVGATTAFVVK